MGSRRLVSLAGVIDGFRSWMQSYETNTMYSGHDVAILMTGFEPLLPFTLVIGLLMVVSIDLLPGLSRHAPPSPWITEEVRTAKCHLRKAEKQWRSSALTIHRQSFVGERNFKTTTKRLTLSTKRKYHCENLSVCS